MEENSYRVFEGEDIGQVQVTEDVIATIAGLAATDVDGVESIADNFTNEIAMKLGRKNLASGVKVKCSQGNVAIALGVVVKMGSNVREVATNVQEKVKQAIMTMTGLSVSEVNVTIANITAE